MANKPLQSIKFPGLSDTYVVPQIDNTLTQTGQAADAEAVRTRIDAITDGITVNTTGSTKLYLYVGDTVILNVSELTNKVNVYISGHNSNVLLLTKVGHYEYTAAFDGFLAFFFFNESSMAANVKLKTGSYSLATDVSKLNMVNFETKTLKLEVGTIDSAGGGNVSNSAHIRTIGYVDANVLQILFNPSCVARLYAYKSDGTYVGRYTGTGFDTDWSKTLVLNTPINMEDFSSFRYKYRIVFYNADGSTQLLSASSIISTIKSTEKTATYTVGAGMDFSTFTEMLMALKDDDSKKTVYIYGGEYDIFEEIGGATYIESVDTSKNWRDVCHVVPPNTTIIGIGDVILKWNPTDEQIIDNDHAFLFSPLNLSGTCTIKNIKIECSNCRYGIHDETSGRPIFNGTERNFENVSVIYSKSTYGTHYAYGAGHNKNSRYRFKNCVFSAAYQVPWSTHDWPATAAEGSTFEFDNCVFLDNNSNNPGTIRLSSSDKVGRLDDVKINGCVFSKITFGTEGSAAIKQGYKVTTMLSKPYTVEYSSYIAEEDKIEPVNYLTLN